MWPQLDRISVRYALFLFGVLVLMFVRTVCHSKDRGVTDHVYFSVTSQYQSEAKTLLQFLQVNHQGSALRMHTFVENLMCNA